MTALILGTLLAVVALAFVLHPIFFPPPARATVSRAVGAAPGRPTREKDLAVAALREIEFDRATGKLSESDYAELKQRYTERAIAAMRREEGAAPAAAAATAATAPEDEIEAAVLAWRARQPTCVACGPRPEPDAVFCSSCGGYLAGQCAQCGAAVGEPGARFCSRCGHGLAA